MIPCRTMRGSGTAQHPFPAEVSMEITSTGQGAAAATIARKGSYEPEGYTAMFKDTLRGIARETMDTARDAFQATHTYVLAQRRKLVITACATFASVEIVGNALLTVYPLLTTGALPPPETLATNALIATLAAILIEHLAIYEVLRLGYLKAIWTIAGQAATTRQLRHLLTPSQTRRYLPPATLLCSDGESGNEQTPEVRRSV